MILDIVGYLIHFPDISLLLKQKNGKYKQSMTVLIFEQQIQIPLCHQIIFQLRNDDIKSERRGAIEEHLVSNGNLVC